MELRHLRYFVKVAEELHFGRAAQHLGIAQPPLSQQIRALEDEIGVSLFTRTKRRVELTAAGRVFLRESRKCLDQAEQAICAAQSVARGELGELVVGFVSSAAYGKLSSILRLMKSRYPAVSLILQDLTSEEQVKAVKAHNLDVGLVRSPVATESLAVQIIWREPLMVVLPQKHQLASEREIAIEALAEESFLQIRRSAGPWFYDHFIRICGRAGFSPKIVQEARTSPTIISLIAGGMGVSILPASLQSLQLSGVVYKPVKPPAPTSEMAVIWHPDNESPALRSFLEILWELT